MFRFFLQGSFEPHFVAFCICSARQERNTWWVASLLWFFGKHFVAVCICSARQPRNTSRVASLLWLFGQHTRQTIIHVPVNLFRQLFRHFTTVSVPLHRKLVSLVLSAFRLLECTRTVVRTKLFQLSWKRTR